MTVSSSILSNNTQNGVKDMGANSTTYLGRSTIVGNTTAFGVFGNGALFSFGDNAIKGNGSDGGAISLVSAK